MDGTAPSYYVGQLIGMSSVFSITFLLLARLVIHCRGGQRLRGLRRAVLITGCDSGFGHSLARRLDAEGFVVFAGCLFPHGDGAKTLKNEGSSHIKILKLDVTSDEDVQQAERFVISNLPEKGLWAVVNNAGISDWAETEWNTIEDYHTMAEVNLYGSIRISIAFLPLVRASKGRMVYVSSIFAFFNCLNMGAYSISKRGLEAFADCLRVEMASFGVKVSIIQPGNFGAATSIIRMKTATDIWEKLKDGRKKIFNEKYIELANDYFMSTCRSGFKDSSLVIDAMMHAITAHGPKHRYLLVAKTDMLFFYLIPYLPTFVTDAIFTLSPMYKKRQEMLFLK
ncbi:D-beta-hydroxybutyrate dehydrogenase, mitochondrial [Aplochiton taeniatus]